MRNWLPRSRPSRGYFHLGSPEASYIKLYPGAAAEGLENMTALLEGATRITAEWVALKAAFTLEAVQYGDMRPTLVWLGVSDVPSGIVHFPLMSGEKNAMFRGWHSLLLRVVDE